MIRRSASIAAIAVVLSVLVHFLGLAVTWRVQPEPQPSGGETSTEVATPGSEFEDLVETVSEPAPPELAPEPEPPEPTPEPEPPAADEPVPETAEEPTSEVHIASDTPQQDRTPDGETAQAVEITEATGTSQVDAGDTPEPTTVEPVGAEQGEAPDAALTPPPGTDTVTDIPQGEPSEPIEPSETPSQTTEVSPSTSAPTAAAPVPSVAVAPVSPAVPVVSLQPSEIEPETPPVAVEPVLEPPQEPVETVYIDPSDNTVTTSLRPRLPTKRPTPKPDGARDGSRQTTTARRAPAPRIESPLTAYKRNGSNIFGQQGGGARSGGQGFRNSNNGGNSDRTNYAGLVLTQLNRTPDVAVSGRGWARVLFRINPNGTLESVVVVDSSGSSAINRAAQQTVRAAGRFPRTPDGQAKSLNFFYRIR